MSDEPKIKVVVSAEQRVQYSQIREIPASLFAEYEAMCDRYAKDSEFNDKFEYLIDYSDVLDHDELEDIEISLYKPEGKTP